ncbi:MAG: rRNA maturation RNase YbeY [Phycisphaerales bacterium]
MESDETIEIEVTDASGRLDADRQTWLAHRARCAMQTVGVRGRLGIRIVGDAEMKRAHSRHSGVEGTTDVLTFDLRSPTHRGEPGELRGIQAIGLDTDVLVCIDEAARQTATNGLPVERELLLYVVHGLMHCLGHDDHDPEAASRMHGAEDALLIELGVGATFGSVP